MSDKLVIRNVAGKACKCGCDQVFAFLTQDHTAIYVESLEDSVDPSNTVIAPEGLKVAPASWIGRGTVTEDVSPDEEEYGLSKEMLEAAERGVKAVA